MMLLSSLREVKTVTRRVKGSMTFAGQLKRRAAAAQTPEAIEKWSGVGYWQQSFPRQEIANQQINSLNGELGTHFKTWSDVVNANVGAMFLRRASRYLKLGVEVDFSKGRIAGTETIMTEAGP